LSRQAAAWQFKDGSPEISRAFLPENALEGSPTPRLIKMPRVTITVPDRNPQPYRFQLDREVVRLGRGSDNDIVVESGSVSTSHAEMWRVTGGYELRDIGSTNGLKVDGSRYETVPLYHGGSVNMGDVAFDFSLTDEEQEMLAAELDSAPGTDGTPPPTAVSTQPMGQVAQPRSVPKRQVVRVEDDGGGTGTFAALIFVLFSVAAFATGLSVRYGKETGGGSLIEAVKAKFFPEKKEAAPVKSALETVTPAPEPTAPAAATAPAPVAPPAPPIPAAPAAPAAPGPESLPAPK
jgi:predicted component of type VI protein secretion system